MLDLRTKILLDGSTAFSLSEVGMKVFFKEDFQEEMEEGRGTRRERDRGVMKRNNERVK